MSMLTDSTELQGSAQEQELDPVENALQNTRAAASQLVMLELWALRRKYLHDPALVRMTLGNGGELQTERTIKGDQRDPFNGVAIFNPTSATVAVGFQVGAGLLAPIFVPPFSYLTLPERFVNLSLALPIVGDQQQTYANPITVLRMRTPPDPSAGGYGQPSLENTDNAANPGSTATIGAGGTSAVIATNPNRRELIVVNQSATGWVTMGFSSSIPTMFAGIPLAPNGGSWVETLWQGPVSMIAAAAGTVVSIVEV